MKKSAVLLLLVLAGCPEDKGSFPSSVDDATYSNGHALALNEQNRNDQIWEDQLVDLTNAKRASMGLPELSRNQTLNALARAHSLHMWQHTFFDHDNPEGETSADRLRHFASDVPWISRENIWIVEPGKDPQYVLDGFLASPAHYDAIVSPSHLIGVGMVRKPFNSIPDHLYVSMEFVELR